MITGTVADHICRDELEPHLKIVEYIDTVTQSMYDVAL